MLHSKDDLLVNVCYEIQEREQTRNQMDDPGDITDLTVEIAALISMKTAIQNEEPLEFGEYLWLTDLMNVVDD